MAETSNYEQQLRETARLVAGAVSMPNWDLVYQSRSGPPTQPWLEPDILHHLRQLHSQGIRDVIVAPFGFISDHLEVLFDLDTEAVELAHQLGMNFVRAGTAGTHPAFIGAIRQLIQERLSTAQPRLAIGAYPPNHDVCPANCCPAPQRPRPQAAAPVVMPVPAVG